MSLPRNAQGAGRMSDGKSEKSNDALVYVEVGDGEILWDGAADIFKKAHW